MGWPHKNKMNNYTLTITNDMNRSIDYTVFVDEKQCKGFVKNGVSQYKFISKEGSCVKIYKENQWEEKNKIEMVFSMIFNILDFYAFEADNLPVGTDVRVELSQDNEIHLSNILTSKPKSIQRWMISDFIRILLISIVIQFISFFFFMIFPHPLNIIISVLVLIGTILLFIKWRKKSYETKTMLEKLLPPE